MCISSGPGIDKNVLSPCYEQEFWVTIPAKVPSCCDFYSPYGPQSPHSSILQPENATHWIIFQWPQIQKSLIFSGQNLEIQLTVSQGRCLQLGWCSIQAAACRPVGKRGVQSGIFEDEQELLPGPSRAVCRWAATGWTAPERTPAPRQEANTTVWESLWYLLDVLPIPLEIQYRTYRSTVYYRSPPPDSSSEISSEEYLLLSSPIQ
jgi:hypothetical protein